MEGHKDVVLQQWVQARPIIGRIRNAHEWVRWADHQAIEEDRYGQHREHGPADHRVVEAVTETVADDGDEPGEDQRPDEDRSFERTPQGCDREQDRCAPSTVVGHVLDAEVVGEKSGLHHDDANDRCQQHEDDVDPHRLHQVHAVAQQRIGASAHSKNRCRQSQRNGTKPDQYMHELMLQPRRLCRRCRTTRSRRLGLLGTRCHARRACGRW